MRVYISLAIWSDDGDDPWVLSTPEPGIVDGAFEVEATWVRHFISSVGADTRKVARPPTAPAAQIFVREVCWSGAVPRRVRVRL